MSDNNSGIRKLIRLRDFVGYLDDGPIQVSIHAVHDGWDDFEQVRANSPLLNPYLNWFITDMDICRDAVADRTDYLNAIIRVRIEDIGA